jgi:hypothetical protein
MADVVKTFEPLNDLESALIQAQAGNLSAMDFLGKLSTSKVFVLLDKELPPSGLWDNSASLMVLSNIAGTPVLALFTAPERSEGWPAQFQRFSFGLLTDFSWLIRGIAKGVGIVVNPGHSVGLEISPERVAELAIEAATNKAT